MKKLIILLLIFLSGVVLAQDRLTNPIPIDWKGRPVAVQYILNSDGTYSPMRADTAVVLVDSTNATVQSSYVYFSMNSYKYAAIAVNFDDSTSATFYSSIYSDADTTDETSGDWGDISTAVIGADSVAFGTNTNYYITDALFPNALILIKYNKWGDTNSIKIGVKKGY